MQFDLLLKRLTDNATLISQLVQTVSPEQARWKPNLSSWSILEVINHLYDEEREDFRVHLALILHHPQNPWTSINPQGWVQERSYNERNLETSLNQFMAERKSSLEWLQGLKDPDWETRYSNPMGSMQAGDMLSAWVAHDLLHARQMVELQYAYLVEQAKPYKVDYAGEW
jgi:hypothetical protein